MKALPATLFILSGRPQGEPGDTDPIESRLNDASRKSRSGKSFSASSRPRDATHYLNSSRVAEALTADETEALVLLSGGHPLWLAFAISYVSDIDIPEEARVSKRGTPEEAVSSDRGTPEEETVSARGTPEETSADLETIRRDVPSEESRPRPDGKCKRRSSATW